MKRTVIFDGPLPASIEGGFLYEARLVVGTKDKEKSLGALTFEIKGKDLVRDSYELCLEGTLGVKGFRRQFLAACKANRKTPKVFLDAASLMHKLVLMRDGQTKIFVLGTLEPTKKGKDAARAAQAADANRGRVRTAPGTTAPLPS